MHAHRKIREEVIKLLYQNELLEEDLASSDLEVNKIVSKINENIEEIDEEIEDNLFNYTINRLSFLDRAIIRLAVYELKYTDLAEAIIIDEAVELTKKYTNLDDEKQRKFNNSLLDNVAKSIRG